MTDISITPANVVPGSNAVVENGHAGETITAGMAVYLDTSTMKYMKADNNGSSATIRTPRGVALNGASNGQPMAIQRSGDVTIGATIVAGTTYYLSDTPGGICPFADVGNAEYAVIMGIATSASVLRLAITYSGVALAT